MEHKKKKTNTTAATSSNGGGSGEEEDQDLDLDLISKLPDSLVEHILSYLDMITVIQTCVLSKSWRYIWSSLPFLNFDYEVYYNLCSKSEECFLSFVGQALTCRNQNSNIHSFHVSYTSKHDWIIMEDHFDTWIYVLIRSNVQVIDLQISFDHSPPITLPISLFTCKSLTTLKLEMGYSTFNVPPPLATAGSMLVDLPALKTLHLKSLWLLEESAERLISRIPLLETLFMYDCSIKGEILAICNPQLKTLVIEKLPVYLCVYVSAPKLTSFKATDYHLFNSFFDVPSIANVEIEFKDDFIVDHESGRHAGVGEEEIENALECLRGICNVRSLMIPAWLLEELAHNVPERLETLEIVPFCNLSFLKLNISFSKHQICGIMDFLNKCPNLETLVLKTTEVKSVSVEEECWNVDLAPQYMMRHLKLVEIWDVLASANELEFLKWLLKNSLVLEKMIVFTSQQQSPNNYKSFRRFGEKLISFRGASSSIRILFV